MMGWGMGFGLFGVVFMILFWVALIALAVWLVRGLFPSANKQPPVRDESMSVQEILDRRYAKGEISQEQYNQMKRTISTGNG
jgi:putative membrane protein